MKIEKNDAICLCTISVFSVVMGSRAGHVLGEIVRRIPSMGMARVHWAEYRKIHGISKPNLKVILHRLEDRGVICRDVGVDGKLHQEWSGLWVNPSLIRPHWLKDKALAFRISEFNKKIELVREIKSKKPETPQEESVLDGEV